jgi:para-aminobenzoate synthetase/4-amino-4-deoxychorismate lyase
MKELSSFMAAWTDLPESLRALAASSPDAVLLETSRFDDENRHSYLFLHPVEVFAANTAAELDALFQWMELSRRRGRHLAGYLSYECGYLLEPRSSLGSFSPPSSGDLPLAWFGAYAEPFVFNHAAGAFLGVPPPEALSVTVPDVFATDAQLDIEFEDYTRKILAIKSYIEAGDTYQVNFTDSVTLPVPRDAASSFTVLAKAQPVAYSALLHTADHHILSLSPELFFRIQDGRITTRPMKGTMSRGLDLAEDQQQTARLLSDDKNRSEHVMIVDLLRNDLGKICSMGSVRVDQLFSVERYRTLLQMTSTVSGELTPGLNFGDIFRAIFPSGSITGAPKIRTMQIIRELERHPRGIYTGAIGHISPSGDATFNVAIRTLVLHNGIATMGVGGGIVADSDPASEYRECQLKASFLTRPSPPFQIIETMLFDGHGTPLLSLHLDRLAGSAAYFEFLFDRASVESRIRQLQTALSPGQRYRVRLLLANSGDITLTSTEIAEDASPLTVRISPHRINSRDLRLRHKTTLRDLYDREYARARADGFDEVLFLNERDELTEGAISTLFVNLDGQLLTPPLAAGVLPGVLRRQILETREDAAEAPLFLRDLSLVRAVFLGNSVRGLRPVSQITPSEPGAQPLFFQTQPC